jgi:Sulfotransferase domain
MDAKGALLIHVGYHKTGTTWLQRTLFQPRFGYSQVLSHDEVFASIVRPHGLDFAPQAVRESIAMQDAATPSDKVRVISSEILVGNPFLGGRESDAFAARLKTVAPGAKILITVREQIRAATSTYMQYVSRGGTLAPRQFFADQPPLGYLAFAPEHLEYDRLVRLYRSLFGEENVHVATQESLAREPHKFAADLARFVGMPSCPMLDDLPTERVLASPPECAAPLLRRVNLFLSGPASANAGFNLGSPARLTYRAITALSRRGAALDVVRRAQPVTREVTRRFSGRYLESNKKLKAMLGDRVDLSTYPG